MSTEPQTTDADSDVPDPRHEQAALYYAGALSPEEAAEYEAMLERAEAALLAESQSLERVVAELVDSIPPEVPPPSIRQELLQRVAAISTVEDSKPRKASIPERVKSDNPRLEQLGIFIRHNNEADWQDHRIPGVRFRHLYVDHERQTQTMLMRLAPGAKFPSHPHRGPEECLVLEGDLRIDDEILLPGDFQRGEPGSRHMTQWTELGCLVLITAPLN